MGSTSFARLSLVLSLPLWTLIGCGDEEPLEHSVIKLALKRSAAATESPYPGTVRIDASVTYESCLREFYTQNPDYTQEGILGDQIFGEDPGGEQWLSRLCEPAGGYVNCTVLSFDQSLEGVGQLTVHYDVTADPDVEDKLLRFGPLPSASLAGCSGGGAPIVRLSTLIDGKDRGGAQLWYTETLSDTIADVGQGAEVSVYARQTR